MLWFNFLSVVENLFRSQDVRTHCCYGAVTIRFIGCPQNTKKLAVAQRWPLVEVRLYLSELNTKKEFIV